MDEARKRQLKEFADQVRGVALTPGQDTGVIGPDGTPWQIRREADGGIVLNTAGGGGMVTHVWQPAPERPC